MSWQRTLDDHLFEPGPKRILSLDGGGVRGLITLGLLQRVEDILKARSRQGEKFRLCDYFDLIGGTSTGGIIAMLLALGYKVADIRTIYLGMCPRVFENRRGILEQVFNPYSLVAPTFDAKEFERAINEVIKTFMDKVGRRGHAEPTLGTDLLRTGLAIVTKRVDTGSVWALTNNKRSKYWDPDGPYWKFTFANPADKHFANKDYPLALLARATASAPFLLEAVEWSVAPGQIGVFLDGGASPFNNPALALFLMTTLKEYTDDGKAVRYSPFGFDWEAGENNLLLYSVGTGTWRRRVSAADYNAKRNWEKAKIALVSTIDDSMKSSLVWLQALSQPRAPYRVDGELETMQNLRILPQKLLTFRRVNLELQKEVVESCLGQSVTDRVLDRIQQFDNADKANLTRLDKIGKAAAAKLVEEADFPAAFDPPASGGRAQPAA
jgi:hypothetical protein